MQETGLFIAIAILCAAIGLGCAWFVANQVGRLLPLRRKVQEAIDNQVELGDRIEVAMTGVRRIEGRIVKQQQRAPARDDPDAEPDSKIDPERWKAWKNRQLATANRSRVQ